MNSATFFSVLVPLNGGIFNAMINDQGNVMGGGLGNQSGKFTFFAYFWDPADGAQLLTSLVPTGWDITNAFAINNSNQILASGTFMGGPVESILLTPTPEPATALLALAFLRRRRA